MEGRESTDLRRKGKKRSGRKDVKGGREEERKGEMMRRKGK